MLAGSSQPEGEEDWMVQVASLVSRGIRHLVTAREE